MNTKSNKGSYTKGHTPWTTGKPRPESVKKKIAAALIGKYKCSEENKNRMREQRLGKGGSNWKGGRFLQGGYVFINSPSHPFRNSNNCVFEHRLVMEAHLGRTLLPTEVVHHINGIRDDNRIENLMLFTNGVEHLKHHRVNKLKERE